MCGNVTTFPKKLLVEKREIIADEPKIASSFSKFSENAKRALGVKTSEYSHENYSLKNPFETAINKFELHPSISLINKTINKKIINNKSLPFSPTEHESILKESVNLVNKKLLKTFLLNIPELDVSDVCNPTLAKSAQQNLCRKF